MKDKQVETIKDETMFQYTKRTQNLSNVIAVRNQRIEKFQIDTNP